MEEQLAFLMESWQRNGSPGRILIALSGGADSVALFCMLKALSKSQQLSLAAVHVNHGLRDTANRDADFCLALCEKHHVPFFLKEVHLKTGGENEARQARYVAIGEIVAKWHADAVATAHHSRDQAETVLLHLLRGSGAAGLSGMAEMTLLQLQEGSLRLWRPLLKQSPSVLKSIALEQAGSYCHDETNESNLYLRNFLRNQVLPLIEERIPNAREALCRASEIIRADHMYLDGMAKEFLSGFACSKPPVPWMRYEPFSHLDESLKSRVMKSFLPQDANYDQIKAAAEIKDGAAVNLPGRRTLKKHGDYLCIAEEIPQPLPLAPLLAEKASAGYGDGIHRQAVPLEVLKQCSLRYRKPGDMITPIGMQGKRKLKDYLSDRNVPQPMRDHLPVLCIGNRIVWVIGIGPGEDAKCSGKADEILLTYTGRLPFEM